MDFMGCNASTPSNTDDNALSGHIIRELFDPHPAPLDKKPNKKGSMTEPKKKERINGQGVLHGWSVALAPHTPTCNIFCENNCDKNISKKIVIKIINPYFTRTRVIKNI